MGFIQLLLIKTWPSFGIVFCVNYEAHERNPSLWPYVVFDQKRAYPAYPAKWPSIFSWLDFRITLGFYSDSNPLSKDRNFSVLLLFQNISHVI